MSLTPAPTDQPIRHAPEKETVRMPSRTLFRVLDALASIIIVILAVGTGAATAFLNA